MNIGFWDNSMGERGTTVSLYDYAYFNQKLLKNKSFVFYDKNNRENKEKILKKFQKICNVYGTNNFQEVDDYIIKHNISHIYIIKSGEIDNRISKVAKNCIHCVFNCNQPHGDIFSSISTSLWGYKNSIPIVPHMIHLPKHNENLRKKLNIPENAIVYGGYGGKDSFNIPFVHKVVYYIAVNNPHIYFLFANFNQFCQDLPNIIHLPMIIDLHEKVSFINSCNAMIWARNIGETFGIAIGEFSTMNKPVIAMKIGALNHYNILRNKGIWYSNENELAQILLNFHPETAKNNNWNAYNDYSPEKVMTIFKNVYLI